MINFQTLDLANKAQIDRCLMHCGERGCEFSFNNMFLWGRQRFAFVDGFLVFFCQYNRRTVYTYPVGQGDKKKVLERIMDDAAHRGIPCRLSGLTAAECEELEALFPGKFRIHCDRNSFDYIYNIDDLADLKGRKYQRKRNHANKFRSSHPDYTLLPLDETTVDTASQMISRWYEDRLAEDPTGDYHMEKSAIRRALHNLESLQMEGLLLMDGADVLAVTLGAPLSEETFDVNFEKARSDVDGAYTVINQEFARYLREKYPQLKYLNREDDLGLEGLRKAKESYYPDHMAEKCWACLLEDGCDY